MSDVLMMVERSSWYVTWYMSSINDADIFVPYKLLCGVMKLSIIGFTPLTSWFGSISPIA